MLHSVLINDILSKKELPIEIIRKLEYGLIFKKLEYKAKSERRLFCIQLDLSRIVWVSGRDEIEGAVNLRDIKEVRLGKYSKTFEKWSEETKICSPDQIFAILYGRAFRLKEITCIANTSGETDLWVNGVEYLRQTTVKAPYHAQIDIMLRREFAEINRLGSSNQPNNKSFLKDMKTFLPKIHCKLSTEQLKKHFHEVDKAFARQLDFEGFSTFFLKLMHSDVKFFNDNLNSYTSDGKRITLNHFINFLKNEQKDEMHLNEREVSQLMIDYLLDPMRHYEVDPYFTVTEFIDFLFSKRNGVWDTKYDEVYQDMSQPLTHYLIATSHNTYLSGDQFKSESSVECYARSLRMGCRCIELDCWDGPDGKPLIYHGRTLTSKIRFIDVIQTIKEHAFVTSEYPVVLSIENHCSVKQQQYMAAAFIDVFRDSLLCHQIDTNEQAMPSPMQLKRKIILKHKKLSKAGEEKPLNSPKLDETTNELDLDISNSIKNGILYLEDPIEKKWKSHYFMLTREKLYYIEPKVEEEEEEEENLYGYRNSTTKPNSQLYQDSAYELHYGEMWFHGKLKGGRAEAESLLQRYSYIGDGTFLVRESETHTGDYSLSFLHQNEVHHSRILVNKSESGHKAYSLNDFVSFTSLYELMTHYQSHPLRSQKFKELYLTSPVPQPSSHEDKIWFNKNMTRAQAEDMLRRLRNDGAFLVRPSEKSQSQDENLFAISFRAENKIKHCRIKREGRLYVIGSAEFESLTELIEYYEKHPLYRKVKLKFPATEENVRILGGEPIDVETQCSYMDPKVMTTNVKACYDYQAKGPEELSFKAGDIITNVVKQDHGWWRGDFNGNIGWYFPSNFVEEFEEEDIQSFDKQNFLGDLKHDCIELDSSNLVVIPYLPNQNRGREWIFRLGSLEISAQTEDEMKEWINKIQEAIQLNKTKLRNSKEVKQNLKIAPELNSLIVYCSAVPFTGCSTHFTEMSSFHEIKIEKLINVNNFRNILKYNEKQLSRVYPKGTRLDSSNYDPIRMWNCGVQMVALNYQTPDKPMQLNEAMFMQNGNCGYVLKPKYMFNDNFNPYEKPSTIEGAEPLSFTVRVLAARNLKKAIRGIVSPSIEIEIIGVDFDARKCLTRVINDNGLNPVWSSETFLFNISCPELALIRFCVSHRDTFDDSSFVGQATYPIMCLRQGYRSVQLKNEYSEELELATLLIHIDIRKAKDDGVEKIYNSILMLEQSHDNLNKMIEETEKSGNQEEVLRLKCLLRKVDEQLKNKKDERLFMKNRTQK